MILAQTTRALDWGLWIGYELVVAVFVLMKNVAWFRGRVRDVRAALASWVGLLLIAFFAAIGLSQWRETGHFAALVAFGLASGIIVSGAVNASYQLGLRSGGQSRNSGREPS